MRRGFQARWDSAGVEKVDAASVASGIESKSPAGRSEGRDWIRLAADVIQLVLDLIRVGREGNDLYRKIRSERRTSA